MLRWSFDVCQDPGCSLAQLPSKSWSAPMIDSGSRCLSIKWWIFQTFGFGLLFGARKLGIIWYIAEMEEMDQTNQNIYRSLWRYFHEWSSSDGNSSSSQGTYSNIHLQLADISLDCIPFFVSDLHLETVVSFATKSLKTPAEKLDSFLRSCRVTWSPLSMVDLGTIPDYLVNSFTKNFCHHIERATTSGRLRWTCHLVENKKMPSNRSHPALRKTTCCWL